MEEENKKVEEVQETEKNEETSKSKKEKKEKKPKKPSLIERKKLEREAKIAAVDLTALSKPVNDVETSGPKKMKDFSQWAWWKSALVGFAGIVFVFILWWVSAIIRESNGETSWLSSPPAVWNALVTTIQNGILWKHLSYSIQRILIGYALALCASIPVGFIMAWYKPFRAFLDPFIQFLRCIPPIAYVPVVVASMGVGEEPKYFIIFLAVFLTMTVTIYQGVKNVDLTLVKAAYTFGARDRNLFTGVIVPSAFPFILTAMRLGVGAAMTTLVAAELTGATYGLGSYINTQGNNLRMDTCIMGILLLGIFGILFDKVLLFVEKRLTRWK